MDKLPDLDDETFLQALRRDYANLAAWVTRLNRLIEPARAPEPTRVEPPARTVRPARVVEPARR